MKQKKELQHNDKILIVIPAYNEEESILDTYQSVMEYNKKHKSISLDVIVINDGSRDSTKQILEDYHIPHINLVHNLGIGGAVQTGYKYALENNYDYVVQFDGDGQHDINYVETILEPLRREMPIFVSVRAFWMIRVSLNQQGQGVLELKLFLF